MQVSFTTHGYCAEMIKKGNLFEDGFTSKCHKHGLIVNKHILLGPLVFLQHPFVYFLKTSWIYKIKYMQPCITLTHVLQTCWEGSPWKFLIMISDKNTLDLNLLCFFEHDIDHPQQKRNMNIRIFPPKEKLEDWMFFVSNAKIGLLSHGDL